MHLLHEAGQTVRMSSLLLGDPTKSFFKLSLWREAAVWVERIAVGDIVYFTSELIVHDSSFWSQYILLFPRHMAGIKLKRWQGESVGHTMMCSTVLNLHLPKKELPTRGAFVPPASLFCCCFFAHQMHVVYSYYSSVRQTIPPECLHSLKQWAMKRHGYLFPSSSPTPKSQSE